MAQVTINFVGVDVVGGGQKTITVKVDGEVSLGELFRRLGRQLGIEGFGESVESRFLVLVNGTSVDWLRKSEVLISPGSSISITPLVAGGST